MEAKKEDAPGLSQEQASAIVTQAVEDLQKSLGNGTRIVIMTSRVGPGAWGYSWSIRGDSLGVLGLIRHAGQKIQEWLATNLG